MKSRISLIANISFISYPFFSIFGLQLYFDKNFAGKYKKSLNHLMRVPTHEFLMSVTSNGPLTLAVCVSLGTPRSTCHCLGKLVEGLRKPRKKVPAWTKLVISHIVQFDFVLIPDFWKKTYVTSIFRREFLKGYTFADAHLLTRVTSYDSEVITNMFFVLVLRILKIRAFPF